MMVTTITTGDMGPTISVDDEGRVTIDGLTEKQLERVATRRARAAERARARAQQAEAATEGARRMCRARCSRERYACSRRLLEAGPEHHTSRAVLGCHTAWNQCNEACGR